MPYINIMNCYSWAWYCNLSRLCGNKIEVLEQFPKQSKKKGTFEILFKNVFLWDVLKNVNFVKYLLNFFSPKFSCFPCMSFCPTICEIHWSYVVFTTQHLPPISLRQLRLLIILFHNRKQSGGRSDRLYEREINWRSRPMSRFLDVQTRSTNLCHPDADLMLTMLSFDGVYLPPPPGP